MSDDIRERLINRAIIDADGIDEGCVPTTIDWLLAEIQRTHAIVPHSDMIALRGIVARDELRRHGLAVPSGNSGELAASPPQPPTRAGGDEP